MMEKNSPKILNNEYWIEMQPQFTNPDIKAVFSYRSFPTNGEDGRRLFAKKVGLNYQNLIIPRQTHSTNVNFFSSADTVQDCDGVFTKIENNVCTIQVADCMPVYFAHSSENVFGLVHAGWRGLVNGILDRSANLIKEEGYDLSDFEIIIGPSIQNCCFEVGNDIINNFKIEFVTPIDNAGKYKVDLQMHAFNDLQDIGFEKINISISTDCTYCEVEKYHSYRRDGEISGRMIGLIGSGKLD